MAASEVDFFKRITPLQNTGFNYHEILFRVKKVVALFHSSTFIFKRSQSGTLSGKIPKATLQQYMWKVSRTSEKFPGVGGGRIRATTPVHREF